MKILTLVLLLLACSCSKTIDPQVQKLGSTEVTAQLVEIPGPLPSNDLYNYAYVFKYKVLQVHRGKVDGDTIYIGQYNPLKPRAKAADTESGKMGGDVEQFRAGDTHRMALETPLDQQWMGGIIDKYFEQKAPRYWAVWTVKAN
jgi:hypothetical protein